MDVSFTERELDVMAVLWELGSGTVAEVRDLLQIDLAYTTVLTVLRTLEEKGFIEHEEEGKAHRYFPKVARLEAGRSAVSRIVAKMFGGSSELLMSQLVSDQRLTDAELGRLRRLLDDRLRQKER